jgi:NADH:ubiquinone oxidoreductase subunit H
MALFFLAALPMGYLAWKALHAFVRDVRCKRRLMPNRLLRFNSELLVLGILFASIASALVLHLPARGLLPNLYRLGFAYVLPFLVFFGKSMAVSFVVLWLRWTLPRLRVDQMMSVCWKYLIPLGFFCFIGQGFWSWLWS